MANTKHGLQQTTGTYQLKGVITGVEKDNFYKEIKTRSGKDMRLVNFGVEVAPNKTIYNSLNGMQKDEVFFSKRDKETKKTEIKKVKWNNRNTFNEEGFSLIGTRLGLEKDEEGKNIKKTLVEYDACKEINDNMEDDQSVFIKGQIEFSSYDSDNGKKRNVKFIPQQISLCSKEIDFSEEGFEAESAFSQQIVFMGIEKKDGRYVVSAKIITYSSIEDTEFIIKDDALAKLFKQKLKPYNAIQVHGHIVVEESVEQVQDDDIWGKEDPTKKLNSPTRRELVITGAKGSTLDKTTYSESIVNEAIKKLTQEQQANDDWGSSSSSDEEETDEDW